MNRKEFVELVRSFPEDKQSITKRFAKFHGIKIQFKSIDNKEEYRVPLFITDNQFKLILPEQMKPSAIYWFIKFVLKIKANFVPQKNLKGRFNYKYQTIRLFDENKTPSFIAYESGYIKDLRNSNV